MNKEDHLQAYHQHKEAIFEWALEIKGLENSQRIVGTHASRGIVELLAVYLHEQNLITSGFQLNHTWFKSEKIFNRLPEFNSKKNILDNMIKLENLCEELTYGSPKTIKRTKEAIGVFRKIETKINKLREEE